MRLTREGAVIANEMWQQIKAENPDPGYDWTADDSPPLDKDRVFLWLQRVIDRPELWSDEPGFMDYVTEPERPPDSFWREVPCGHPPEPVAWLSPSGPVCHCGCGLDTTNVMQLNDGRQLVPCGKCGCYVSISGGDQGE